MFTSIAKLVGHYTRKSEMVGHILGSMGFDMTPVENEIKLEEQSSDPTLQAVASHKALQDIDHHSTEQP